MAGLIVGQAVHVFSNHGQQWCAGQVTGLSAYATKVSYVCNGMQVEKEVPAGSFLVQTSKPTVAKGQELLDLLDRDKDGKITKEEYMAAAAAGLDVSGFVFRPQRDQRDSVISGGKAAS